MANLLFLDLSVPDRNFLKPEPAAEGQSYNVAVTYAGKPDCFYAQEVRNICYFISSYCMYLTCSQVEIKWVSSRFG